jgi:hypothetical protein
MKRHITLIFILLLVWGMTQINAQTTSANTNFVAQPIPDRSILYYVSDTGVAKPITWGLDLAWLSESNIRRGIAFMGADRVDIVRSSFTPTSPLVNGALPTAELATLNQRLNIIGLLGTNTKVVLNCDHPKVDPWFVGNAARWAQLIDITAKHHEDKGRTVVSVSPFNEPDNTSTGQGTVTDFYNVCGELRKITRLNNVRISGGNTLNDDQALSWYNTLKARLDEGNTHQLAGNFDNYASFYQTVRANGDYASNDELHNVMEAMVGVEYGMQTGIWWGTAELARGEFVKASDGKRLGYAEHRPNWTAASVYRNLEGKVQAFGGASERQATTTSYRFISKERDVFYDGVGPQREYVLTMPGGTGYQQGQPNAERMINITWGDDIQPEINGRYVLVNRNSGKVMEVAGGSTAAGANLQQGTNSGTTFQQWNVSPVDSRIVGDFSYFTFTAVHSGKSPDILNWSLDNGGNVIVYDDAKGANQQWFLDYAEDGWFYIRSRHSAKCLQVANSSTAAGANIQQWDKLGTTNQQWRFLPVGATVEFSAPNAPSNLIATANPESVRLEWTASPSPDVASYTIFRSETANGAYQTIARNVKSNSFVDNTTTIAGQYFYAIKAVDNSLNRSAYSNQTKATTNGNKDLVAQFLFDKSTLDNTINLNHSATYGVVSYTTGKVGTNAIVLNGTNAFVQLPANLANQNEISISTWVYWNGGDIWQRIFDFGNSETQNMFLSPSGDSGQLRFAIKNGGAEQRLTSTGLPTKQWSHVTVTLSGSTARMYVNGKLVDESNTFTISPLDFKPVLNYIGRSQYPDALLNGYIDDFRIYNYALSANEVGMIAGLVDCQNTAGGSAVLDICDRCVGGTTGKKACSSVAETETEACTFDGITETKNVGYKGTSYINVDDAVGTAISFNITASNAGTATISFRYANGGTVDRPAQISLNGTILPNNLSFPVTGLFTDWKVVDVSLALTKGINVINIISLTTEGLANFDQIGYVSTGISSESCIVTKIEEYNTTQLVSIYPNPSKSTFHLSLSNPVNLQVIDLNGKVVEDRRDITILEFGETLKTGIYFLKIENKVYKLVKE